MRLNVTSEIGRLKSVLVHLPGREIDVMIPPMMTQLLFDDILFGQVAREEHRRFQQLMRYVAEEVFDIQDLLEEVFENEEAKHEIIVDFAKRCCRNTYSSITRLSATHACSKLISWPARPAPVRRSKAATSSWLVATCSSSATRSARMPRRSSS